MSQVRRHERNASPPPRQIPLLPDAIRFQPPPSRTTRRTQSFQINNLPPYAGVAYRQPSPSRTGVYYNPLTGLSNNLNTTTNRNNYNENYGQSHIISSPYNQVTPRGRQIPPPVPPPSSENIYSFPQQQQYEQTRLNNNEREDSVAIPTLGDDDGLPVVSIDKNHLPVFARFPFDVTFIPRTMDTNVEDSIHKLRLRLIDSELSHQRRSTDDYIKRTHRIGAENDPQNNLDIERELEIRRIQDSLNSGRQSNQQLMISNYSYDPRLHLQPVTEERQYSSSNMDDLIDSMARRHLAYRRLDAAMDRQRRGNGGYGPYLESSALARRASLRSQQRNNDLFFTTASPTTLVEPDLIRARGDYYNRNQPDFNGLGTDSLIRVNSYSKLPPISPGIDSSRYLRLQNPSNSALYQAKHNPRGHQNYQQTVPLTLPDHTEHSIELPSDIFLTSRTEPVGSSQRHHRTRKTKPRPISKEKSDVSTDLESDGENNSSNRQRNRHKQKQIEHSENGHHGFFTEANSQQQLQKPNKPRRHLFKKAAIGIYFIITLKHRAAKNRLNRPSQTLSATIHKIRLQEIMVALHRVYLEPDGPIYNALIQTLTSPIELKDALKPSSENYSDAISVLGEALKNVFSRIVDFMPRDGVLGTAKTSAVAALIQDGNPFPENYFWQCEKDILEFNKSKIINVTKQRAMLLLIGIFIFRALITTLLMKPIKYRLILGQLTDNQTASLKVLASVMFYVGRRAAKSMPQILALPHEWELSLYSDADIEPIIQHSEIKSIITTCELSLRVWCEEYILRIDQSFGKELRT